MKKSRAARPAAKLTFVVEDVRWRKDEGALRLLRRAVRAAVAQHFDPPLEGGSKLSSSGSEKKVSGRGGAELSPPRSRLRATGAKPPSTLPQGEGRNAQSATLLLTNDAAVKRLNRDFRGKDKPTNVLSFPGSEPAYLGDIAIAYQTVAKEARAQKKRFAAHAAHLAIHGILHLLGYDHEEPTPAEAMETLEIQILGKLGLGNPYSLPPLTRGRKRP